MPQPLLCSAALLERDLAGHVYVVTGGNSGIGLVTVEQLVKQGAHVVLAARRPAEAERARADVLARSPRGSIEVATLEFESLASVRAFAAAVVGQHAAIRGLVNNAGVMNTPQGKTADGSESQLGTNHLGHYLLIELLLPALRHGAPSRIVNVSSCFHDVANGREGRIDFDDLHFERRRYDGWKPFPSMDQPAVSRHEGPAVGPDAVFQYEGKRLGKGRTEITSMQAPHDVDIVMTFLRGDTAMHAQSAFFIHGTGDSSDVHWTLDEDRGVALSVMGALMFDRMMTRTFEGGLRALKALIESDARGDAAGA